jgi:hypothetical protein
MVFSVGGVYIFFPTFFFFYGWGVGGGGGPGVRHFRLRNLWV